MGKLLEVKDKILADIEKFSGDVAFCIRDTGSGDEIAHREDEVFPTASAVKIFALGAMLEKVDQGKFSLMDDMEMTAELQVRGSGVMKELTVGHKFKIKDAAMLMIIVSDNTGTNMAIELAGGVDGVNDWIRRCGLKKSMEPNPIDFDKLNDEGNEGGAELFGIATAREFCDYLMLMKNGDMLSPEMKEVFFDMLKRQQCIDQVPRYLPYNQYAKEVADKTSTCQIGSKTGFMPGIRTDVGFIWEGDHEICYAVLTKNCKDLSFWAENEANILNGKIGRYAYDAVMHAKV